MALLINGAGTSAADPILDGLRIKLAFAASTFDITTVNDAWIDQAAGFPGTNSVKASLSPAATVVTAGVAGAYNDTADQLTISSTTGLTAGDPIYLSHATITDGIYLIASVVDGTLLTLVSDPFAGGGDQTGISYQVGWAYTQDAGTAPIVSSGAGTQNYFKVDAEDVNTNATEQSDTFYVRDAPAGADYIALDGGAYTGQLVPDTALTLAILTAWANKGGIATVELADHSGQGVNNFTWTSGGGTAERTVALAETSGVTATAGDGMKYGRFLFRSLAGSASTLGVDFSVQLDTSGPTIVLTAFGA